MPREGILARLDEVAVLPFAGVEAGADLRAIDLAAASREYILSTGLSTEEVDALYANLARDYSAEF